MRRPKTDKQHFQAFYTPAPLAARVVELADIEPEMCVLEPSAGEGALVAAITETGADVWAYEITHSACAKLRERFPDQFGTTWEDPGLVCGDFLNSTPAPVFDRIVMNPPFSGGQEARHVLHALDFLAPGGKLVAIMSAGVEFRRDKVYQAVRDRASSIERLPPGSFKESGTMVNTCLVTVEAE